MPKSFLHWNGKYKPWHQPRDQAFMDGSKRRGAVAASEWWKYDVGAAALQRCGVTDLYAAHIAKQEKKRTA